MYLIFRRCTVLFLITFFYFRYADTKFKDIPHGFEVLDENTETPSSGGRIKQNYCSDDSVRVRNLTLTMLLLSSYF